MFPAILVEDNAMIRETLIPSLHELADVEVLDFAETEADGLALITRLGSEAHLVILDLFLRQGTGLGILQYQYLIPKQACIVVLTNHATADMRSRCTRLGAHAVFDKSTELEEFFEFCRHLPEQNH